MKALIRNKKVIQISTESFPVHKSLKWVDCDDKINAGDSYENGAFKQSMDYITKEAVDNGLRRVKYDSELGKIVYHNGTKWEIVP